MKAADIKGFARTCFIMLGCGGIYNAMSRSRHWLSAFTRDVRHRFSMQAQYRQVVRRIREYPATHKIRIAFVVTNVAKWKTQSLLNEIKKHDCFEPFFLVSVINDPYILNHLDLNVELEKEKV